MIPIDLTQSNYGDVRKIKYDLAVLPWGATEPHNLHLSYTTDCLLSQAVAIDAAKKAYEKGVNVMVLPSIPLGAQNPGQRDEPFCIHTRYETQKMVLTDIVASLYHQGMRKLVIVNGHGGNSFKPMIRDLAVDYPDFIIAVTDWFAIVPQAGYFENKDDHAGELETSAMLYYYPEITYLSKAGEGKGIPFKVKSLTDGTAWAPRIWTKATKDTGIGNPALATAEKGEKYVQEVVRRISNLFVELVQTPLY